MKHRTTTLLITMIAILMAMTFNLPAQGVPEAISYQGQLLDKSGQPVTTTVTLTFSFWDQAINGTPLGGWNDSKPVTPDANGIYSTDIGDADNNPIPTSIFDSSEVWLNVMVEGESLSPRTRMQTVPYAVKAGGLSGGLINPGDRISLGNNVWLQVADDGTVEIVANGTRHRLGTQRWFHPSSLADNISPDGQSASLAQVAINASGEAIIVFQQSDGANQQIFKSEYRNDSWTHPASLSDNISPDVQSASLPQVAINATGEAIIVWQQSDGANQQIFKSEYRNGSWTHPSSLTDNISPAGQDAAFSQVAMNDNGEALIVWRQSDGANTQIFKSERRNGVWIDPSSLTDNISPNGQSASDPQVAMNANGDALIVWQQFDGSNNQIFKSEYRSGSWTNPSSLTDNISPNGQVASDPQVAINANGDALIVWQQFDGANLQIFKSEFRSGSWTDPSSLTDNISPDGQATFSPQVALSNNGDAVIVWHQSDGANRQIFKSENRSGSWTDPSSLTDNISPNGQDTFFPQVAINTSGEAVIAWFQSNASNFQIFISEFRSNAWTDPSSLTDNISPDGQNTFDPQVAINDNGETLIVWDQFDGSNIHQVFISQFRSGSWTHPSGLSDNISPDGQHIAFPQVTINASGEAVVVWNQSDGSRTQIFKSDYRNGAWVHPSSLTDNISPNGQNSGQSQTAISNNGDAVIVWAQSDGSTTQIFKSESRFGF